MFFDVYRDLCKSRNISPSAAAIEMGINKGTVSIWKNKGTVPQTPQLKKIADYFNVSVDYLLGNEEKPAPPEGRRAGCKRSPDGYGQARRTGRAADVRRRTARRRNAARVRGVIACRDSHT